MALLSGRPRRRSKEQGVHKRLAFSEQSEVPPLEKEPEMMNSRVGSQEFSVKGWVFRLSGGELAAPGSGRARMVMEARRSLEWWKVEPRTGDQGKDLPGPLRAFVRETMTWFWYLKLLLCRIYAPVNKRNLYLIYTFFCIAEKSHVKINHTKESLKSRFIQRRRKISDGRGMLA